MNCNKNNNKIQEMKEFIEKCKQSTEERRINGNNILINRDKVGNITKVIKRERNKDNKEGLAIYRPIVGGEFININNKTYEVEWKNVKKLFIEDNTAEAKPSFIFSDFLGYSLDDLSVRDKNKECCFIFDFVKKNRGIYLDFNANCQSFLEDDFIPNIFSQLENRYNWLKKNLDSN